MKGSPLRARLHLGEKDSNWTRSSLRRGAVALTIGALLASLILVAPPSRADTVGDMTGADFRAGIRTGTQISSAGELLLAPGPGTWSKHGMVLPAGLTGEPDSVWARDPIVLRDGGTYRMWYRGFDGTTNRIMYASSADGVAWVKSGPVPFAYETIGAPFVVLEGGLYQMWFQGGPSGGGSIFHASSANGLTWSNPEVALTPSVGWESCTVNTPNVVRNATGVLWMYYTGSDCYSESIGVAVSSSYANFSRIQSPPVLNPGPSTWDTSLVRFPSVVFGSMDEMYFGGRDSSTFGLGFAYSEDGLTWTKSVRNPFLRGGPGPAWDSAGTVGGQVLNDPTGARLYYSGSDGSRVQIGLATKDTTAPTYEPGGSFLSRILDSRSNVTLWERAEWNLSLPMGASATLSARVGNIRTPDSTWSGWTVFAASGTALSPAALRGRYLQYRIDLSTPADDETPIVRSVSIVFSPSGGPRSPYPFYFRAPFLVLVLVGIPGAILVGGLILFLRATRRPPTGWG